MARVHIESPAGDEFYPARVERAYFRLGDPIISGDPLYDLETANGRSFHVRASESGKAVTAPLAVGATLLQRESLLEIEVMAPEEGPVAPQVVAPAPQRSSSRRVDLHTPVDSELYPANVMKVHVEPGGRVDRHSVLYTIEAATGAVVELQVPLAGRILSSNDARNLTRQRAIAVIEPDEDDPLAAALGTAGGVYLLAGGAQAGGEDEAEYGEPQTAALPLSEKRSRRWWTIGFLAGLCAIAIVAAASWYVLSFVPYELDEAYGDSYYGQRVNGAPLGGKRRLFISDEQQREFESWLDS
ncbi:hypothetical protein FF124_00590 [Martelella lutilitoris]|uniref:Uncharacterized protein n=1 Tax=Martelella lutilitoris TaxID=2583532 RepID=A0A5C4JW63_9HYPH|nr:hypothetical protein [Martelella lutilitoris]TNB49494.1 hypothetical protein FF124_00590 [Martelella lutilitoris]